MKIPKTDKHAFAPGDSPDGDAEPQPLLPSPLLQPSALVPRRSASAKGRRPPRYPDLNYQVVGGALSTDPTYIGRIMNGHCRPSIQLAERLAAYFGWTIDQVNELYKSQTEPNATAKEKPSGKSGNSRTGRAAAARSGIRRHGAPKTKRNYN